MKFLSCKCFDSFWHRPVLRTCAVLVGVAGGPLWGATWDGSEGDLLYATALNWDTGVVPAGTAVVTINLAADVTYSSATSYSTTGLFTLGGASGVSSVLNVSGSAGTLQYGGDLYTNAARIGDTGGTGTLNISAGKLQFGTGVAGNESSINLAVYRNTGGSTTGGTGSINLSGGELQVGGRILIAANHASKVGAFTLSGAGTLKMVATGSNSQGDNGMLRVGGGAATLNFDGGEFIGRGIHEGDSTVNSKIYYNGTKFTLNGNSGTGVSAWIGSGGNAVNQIKAGGLILNTGVYSGSVERSLANYGTDAGWLRKEGAGVLTLTASNSYTGNTTITGGTLELSASGTLSATDISVKDAAFLQIDATGKTLKSLALEGGSSLWLSADAGTTTLSNALTLVTTPNFTVRPLFLAAPQAGNTFDLLSAASVVGSAGTITTDLTYNGATRVTGSTAISGNKLVLTIDSGAGSLTWGNGAGTGLWDLNSAANFTGLPDGKFMTYDHVTFGDSAAGTVTLSGNLNAGSVTVNSSNDYTFSGSGSIAWLGSLTKSGTGKLNLNTANTYSGGTHLNSGILALGNAGALGSSGTIFFGGGTLQYASGITTDYSSRFSKAGNQAWKIDTNNNNVTFAGILQGTGSTLTKEGLGILTLSGASSYSGMTTVNGGTLKLNAAGAIPAVNSIEVNNGATLTFGINDTWGGSSTLTSAAITINSGGTLASGGKFTTLWNPTLNSGTISPNGGVSTNWGAFQIGGTLTATGTSTMVIGSGFNTINIGAYGNATLTLDTPEITDVFTINAKLQNVPTQTNPLQKTGSGTVLLTGVNTYSGMTTVNGGKLLVNNASGSGTGSGTVSVANDATLGGSGSISGALQMAAGSFLTPGDEGIAALRSGPTSIAGTYVCEVDATSSDQLIVTGALNLTGGTFALAGTPVAQSYTIATYSGQLTGAFAISPALPSGYTLDYATVGEIKLVKVAGFSSWIAKAEYGLAPADQGPAADPDGDGLNNLLEYALAGLNPAVADGTSGGINGRLVSFSKRPEAAADSAIAYRIEESDDLGLTDSWTEVSAYSANNATIISCMLPDNLPRIFARLRVVQTP